MAVLIRWNAVVTVAIALMVGFAVGMSAATQMVVAAQTGEHSPAESVQSDWTGKE